MSFTLNSSQTIAVVAVAAALVAGAYAVGRSGDNTSNAAPSTPVTAVAEAPPVRVAEAPKPEPRVEPKVIENAAPAKPAQARICDVCSRVVSVRSEERQGEGSGLGAIGGAVIGGLLGNQVGGGTGKKIATVGGAVAGGYAGNAIEKNQRTKQVWVVRLENRDGSTHNHEQASDPGLKAGDIVELRDGELRRR
jgi:outer membrane lipoprotein SlyB